MAINSCVLGFMCYRIEYLVADSIIFIIKVHLLYITKMTYYLYQFGGNDTFMIVSELHALLERVFDTHSFRERVRRSYKLSQFWYLSLFQPAYIE